MRVLIGFIFALTFTAPALAQTADQPVVLELYTSQGCSSCPPADGLIAQLAARDDVIALALHVDYWDYIGWKDIFGSPHYTARQKGYARAAGHRTVYTPQMIVGGVDHVVGFKPMQVADLIHAHADTPSPVDLSIRRNGSKVSISAKSPKPMGEELVLQLVRYDPEETVEITRGENAGKTITYHNIVTDWQAIARWDGTKPLEIGISVDGSDPVVAILQKEGQGSIVAAARAR